MDDQNTLGTPDKTRQRHDKWQQRRVCYHQHTIPGLDTPDGVQHDRQGNRKHVKQAKRENILIECCTPTAMNFNAITYFVHGSTLAACAIRGLTAKHPNEKTLCRGLQSTLTRKCWASPSAVCVKKAPVDVSSG